MIRLGRFSLLLRIALCPRLRPVAAKDDLGIGAHPASMTWVQMRLLNLLQRIAVLGNLPTQTSPPKDRLFERRPAGWYLIDFARSRHANPARIPISVNADWYQTTV